MAESADVLASVSVVERVAAVGCGEAELTAIIDGANVLENWVDGLENAAFQFLELAEFDGIIDAVVLHVVRAGRWLESSSSGHRVTVHVRESAIASDVVEIHRSIFILNNWKLKTKKYFGLFSCFGNCCCVRRKKSMERFNNFPPSTRWVGKTCSWAITLSVVRNRHQMVLSVFLSLSFFKSPYRGFVCHFRIELNDVLPEWTTANKVFSSSLLFKVSLLVVDIQSVCCCFLGDVLFWANVIVDPVTNSIKRMFVINFPLLILLDLFYF